MIKHYSLNGKTVVEHASIEEWMRVRKDCKESDDVVCCENVSGITVSTIFLMFAHGYRNSTEPLLFETMVFGGEYDGKCFRATSHDEAKQIHEVIVSAIKTREKEVDRLYLLVSDIDLDIQGGSPSI